jgi:hypothetical protein
MSNQKTDVYINTFICYERKAWGRKNTIVVNKFITKIQFPRALLTRFLNMLSSGKLNERLSTINQQNTTAYTPKPLSKVPYGTDELFINTYVYNWIVNKNIRIMLDRDYAATWLMFKLINKENSRLIQQYFYNPTHARFLILKKILQTTQPDPEVINMECYQDFVNTLPKLKNGFVARYILNSENLEKI